MVFAALLLPLALGAASPPSVLLARVQADGMSEEDAAASQRRIEEELVLMGAQPVVRETAAEAACFDDAACVGELAGEHAAVLHVELLRVGPLVQVTARLFDPEGKTLFETDRSVNAEGIAATGTMLGPEIAPHIRGLGAAAPSEEPKPEPEPPAPAAPSDGGSLFLPLVAVGGTLAGVGLLVAAGGGIVAVERTATAYTPTTPGEDKAIALAVAPWAVGAAAFGLVLAAAGGGVLAAAFVLE